MKTLPDNPHLDHLRRQAKDLLSGLRAARPAATLADAQAVLAEQYGFPSWADLKAEVGRRQHAADIADPALAQQIADRFNLGTVQGEMRSMSRPDEIGRRWLLTTDRGRWLPRTVDEIFPPTDGEADTRLQEAAARAGVMIPAPVRATSGQVIEEIGGSRWRVHAWVQSGPPLAAPVSAAITAGVGAALATIHGLRIPASRLCVWSSTRLGALSWSDLVADLAEISDSQAPHADPILCHNNLNPANVRVGTGGRLVVSGWDHAAGLPPAWEFCSALANWAVDPAGGVNVAGARALAAGYRTVAGELPELGLGAFRGTATALLNYVTGQLDMANAASADEDVRFTDRNVRHLLAHLPSRAVYEQLLDAVQNRPEK